MRWKFGYWSTDADDINGIYWRYSCQAIVLLVWCCIYLLLSRFSWAKSGVTWYWRNIINTSFISLSALYKRVRQSLNQKQHSGNIFSKQTASHVIRRVAQKFGPMRLSIPSYLHHSCRDKSLTKVDLCIIIPRRLSLDMNIFGKYH